MGDYLPEHRVAPEWRPLLEHLSDDSSPGLQPWHADRDGTSRQQLQGPQISSHALEAGLLQAAAGASQPWLASGHTQGPASVVDMWGISWAHHGSGLASSARNGSSLFNGFKSSAGEANGGSLASVGGLKAQGSSRLHRLLHNGSNGEAAVRIQVTFAKQLQLNLATDGTGSVNASVDSQAAESAAAAAFEDWAAPIEAVCQAASSSSSPCSMLRPKGNSVLWVTIPVASFPVALSNLSLQLYGAFS